MSTTVQCESCGSLVSEPTNNSAAGRVNSFPHRKAIRLILRVTRMDRLKAADLVGLGCEQHKHTTRTRTENTRKDYEERESVIRVSSAVKSKRNLSIEWIFMSRGRFGHTEAPLRAPTARQSGL